MVRHQLRKTLDSPCQHLIYYSKGDNLYRSKIELKSSSSFSFIPLLQTDEFLTKFTLNYFLKLLFQLAK